MYHIFGFQKQTPKSCGKCNDTGIIYLMHTKLNNHLQNNRQVFGLYPILQATLLNWQWCANLMQYKQSGEFFD